MEQITAAKNVLKKLISPKFGGKVSYDISIETNQDTGTEYFMVDIIINDKEYWKYYNNGPYDSPSYLDDELGVEIRESLKYAGVNKSFIDVYLMEGLEPEESIKEQNIKNIKMNITESKSLYLLVKLFDKFFSDYIVENNDNGYYVTWSRKDDPNYKSFSKNHWGNFFIHDCGDWKTLTRYSDYLDIPQEQFENYLFQYLNSTFSDKFVPGNLVRGINNECRD